MKRILMIVLALVVLVLAGAPSAGALPDIPVPGIPGVTECLDPPNPVEPGTGANAYFGTKPVRIDPIDSPEYGTAGHLFTTGGLYGFDPFTYDLGCGIDVTSVGDKVNTWGMSPWTKGATSLAGTSTLITDVVDRKAWEPGWITTPLEGFGDTLAATVRDRIYPLLMGAGLIVTGLMVIWQRRRDANLKTSSRSIGWSMLVLAVTFTLLASPLLVSRTVQDLEGRGAAAIGGGVAASDSASNMIAETIHYKAWLRRTFGSENDPAAKKYGLKLLETRRISWAEQEQIEQSADPVQARKDLVERKRNTFKDIAAQVKDDDEDGAYRHLTGRDTGLTSALLEVAFALAANAFRLCCALLVMLAALCLLTNVAIWLFTAWYIQTPKGEKFGRSLFAGITSGIRYTLEALIAMLLFSVALDACLSPGINPFMSLVLLLLVTSLGFITLAPVRKMTSLLTLGKVQGTGRINRYLWTAAAGALGAGWAVKRRHEVPDPEPVREPLTVPAEPAFRQRAATVHDIYNPAPGFDPNVQVMYPASGLQENGLPAGTGRDLPAEPFYERPAPPAPGAVSGDPYVGPAPAGADDDDDDRSRA